MARPIPLRERPVIGWREWVGLPDLGDLTVKVKVDTGARTSAIHATRIEPIEVDGDAWLSFLVHPDHDDPDVVVPTRAPVVDRRVVRSSSGEEEKRHVVHTTLVLHGIPVPIELTLTERADMGFRMLLGRRAIRRRFLVDPGRSYRSEVPPAPPGHRGHRHHREDDD